MYIGMWMCIHISVILLFIYPHSHSLLALPALFRPLFFAVDVLSSSGMILECAHVCECVTMRALHSWIWGCRHKHNGPMPHAFRAFNLFTSHVWYIRHCRRFSQPVFMEQLVCLPLLQPSFAYSPQLSYQLIFAEIFYTGTHDSWNGSAFEACTHAYSTREIGTTPSRRILRTAAVCAVLCCC